MCVLFEDEIRDFHVGLVYLQNRGLANMHRLL